MGTPSKTEFNQPFLNFLDPPLSMNKTSVETANQLILTAQQRWISEQSKGEKCKNYHILYFYSLDKLKLIDFKSSLLKLSLKKM